MSKTSCPKVAKKDIVVWKLLIPGDRKGNYVTPYTLTPVDLKKPFKAYGDDAVIEHPGIGINENCYEVSMGWIHSFTSLYYALNYLELYRSRFKLIKAIIPKGTKLFIGDSYDIASKEIQFKKVSLLDRFWAFMFNRSKSREIINP